MTDATGPPSSPPRRLFSFIVGLLLLGAAAYAAISQRADAVRAWDSVRAAGPILIALALILPIVNILVTSLSFWVQMRRHGPIGLGEMSALIGAAWLLNYLPLRPGMFSRLAYHKAVNRIAFADSIRVMIFGMVCGAVAVVIVLVIAATMPPGSGAPAWTIALAAPAVLASGAMLAGARPGWWWLPAVFLARYADMLVWVLRYWVVFRLVGAPISIPQSAAIAAVCQLTLNIPLVGNGLGLREWAVGLTASRLPAELFDSTGKVAMSVGLAADLANRAAELVVAIPVGLGCAAWLARRARGRATAPAGE